MATQRCTSCGEPVKAGARFCAKCGARQPELRGSDEPTQILPALPPTPDQAPGPGPAPWTPATPPTQPAGGSSQPPGYTPPPPPPAKKGGIPWLIVGLGVVGLLAVLGIGALGLSMLGRSTNGGTAGNPTRAPTAARTSEATPASDPTGTAEARLAARTATAEARFEARTATADARATTGTESGAQETADALAAEEQATADALAAAQAQATADAQEAANSQSEQATAVAQATAETAALFAAARQVFSDQFVDNRNNWFTGKWNDQETDVIEGGVFKVLWSGEGASYELYEVRGLNNFIVQVDCVVIKGDLNGSCGIIFAQNPDVGLYKFEVFNDYYRLSLFQADQDSKLLLEGDPAGIVNPNNTNRLKVVRLNNQAFLYLNDQLLDSNTDTTFTNGKIGVSTNSYDETNPVEVWFDNFAVWELP